MATNNTKTFTQGERVRFSTEYRHFECVTVEGAVIGEDPRNASLLVVQTDQGVRHSVHFRLLEAAN